MRAGHVTSVQLAQILMLSPERVRQHIKLGTFQKTEKDQYPLIPCVQGYIRFLKDEERRNSKSQADGDLKRARERQIALKTARDEGELVPVEEAQAYLMDVVGTLKSLFSGLPAGFTRNQEDRERLEKDIDAIWAKVAERMSGDVENYRQLGGDSDADAEDNPGRLGSKQPGLSA